MTWGLIAAIVVSFVGTVLVWVVLDLLHGRQVKPENAEPLTREDMGHLSADSEERIYRIVRRIH